MRICTYAVLGLVTLYAHSVTGSKRTVSGKRGALAGQIPNDEVRDDANYMDDEDSRETEQSWTDNRRDLVPHKPLDGEFHYDGSAKIDEQGLQQSSKADTKQDEKSPSVHAAETVTHFEFVHLTATTHVEPTEGFWCDGGYATLVKKGDLVNDELATAYILGYLEIIGVDTEGIESFDWCYNTKADVPSACWRVTGGTSQGATEDDTSVITLKVCDLPCLEAVCAGTATRYDRLDDYRLHTVSTYTVHERKKFPTPCTLGNGKSYPVVPQGESQVIYFCPTGQKATDIFTANQCEACPDVPFCLAPICTPTFSPFTGTVASPGKCARSELGYYVDFKTQLPAKCTTAHNCKVGAEVCFVEGISKCAYGSCTNGYENSGLPGGSGECC